MNRKTRTAILLAAGMLATGTLSSVAGPFTVTAGLDTTNPNRRVLSISFGVPEGHYLYADMIDLDVPEGVALSIISVPEPQLKYDDFFKETLSIYSSNVTGTYLMTAPEKLSGTLGVTYQGCSPTACFPDEQLFRLTLGETNGIVAIESPAFERTKEPKPWEEMADRFVLAGKAGGYMDSDTFLAFLERSRKGESFEHDALRDTFARRGTLLSVLLILLAGLALNLTPCVLPMIPVNIAIIGAGAQASSRQRGFLLGGAYGAGIAVAYGLLGVLVVTVRAKFGTLNASPTFNFAIAGTFVLMSLAMFGVFHLDFTRFQSKAGQKRTGGVGMAFVLGGIAAILAGACVAPAVVSVLLLSSDLWGRGQAIGLFLPFLLGLGMALPWPFAGAGLSFLPKAGKWMARVKYGFGVVILVAGIYYGYLGASLLRHGKGLGPETPKGWVVSLEEGLVLSEQNGKPVFIDFWASWCKACEKMERTTFQDQQVVAGLESFVKVKFDAEDQSDPKVKAVMDRYVTAGLPTYVILVSADSAAAAGGALWDERPGNEEKE